MLAPKATSSAPHPRKSANALRASRIMASVSALDGYAQWVLALW
jgi:hypothetical protein